MQRLSIDMDAGRFVKAYKVLEFEAEEGSLVEVEHAQRYHQTGRKPSESYGRFNQYYVQACRVTRVALAGPGPEGKPLHGDPRLLRNLLRHIGQSAQADGRVKAHHPSDRWDIHGYIEDCAGLWIQTFREGHDHTGDLDLARELWPAVQGQLQWFLNRRTERGLVKARDLVDSGSNPLCYKVCEGTTLNAYLVRTLRDAAYLAGRLAQSQEEQVYGTAALALAEAMNQHLWDESAGTFHGGFMDGQLHPPTVPAAFMALHFDVVPPARRPRVEQWLRAHHQEQGGLPCAYQFL